MQSAAERGSASARADAVAALEEPPCPESILYLRDWFNELDVSRTVGMTGAQGFTHQQIRAWSGLTGHCPDPLEVEALFAMDVVSRHPDAGVETNAPADAPLPVWPAKPGVPFDG